MSTFNPSRRKFLKSSAVLGGGLLVGISLTGCGGDPLPFAVANGEFVPNALLQITPEGEVRFYCPRDEMGQGVTTGLTTLIAEELGINPLDIDVRLAGVHPDYNNPEMGVQGTGGSNAIKAHYYQLRQIGADTRAVMINAAAKDLGLSADSISLEDGEIVAGGERHSLGRFAATASTLPFPSDTPLKRPEDFIYIGAEHPRVGSIAKATGTAMFGIDAEIPGMHHAVVVRGPAVGGKTPSYDADAILKMPGVTDVVAISSGVAVVAERFWQAKSAATGAEITWDLPQTAKVSTSQVRADYENAMADEAGITSGDIGDIEQGLSDAAQVIEQQYWAPFLAHAPMEPVNAVVRVGNDEAEVWSGTQSPQGAQGVVARVAGIDAEKVETHQTYLGGGFGRRGTLTHIAEATEVAVATGKPIKLVWTREDDIRNGLYRPASLMKIRAGVDESGLITAWDAKRVGGNITPTTLRNTIPALMPGLSQGVVDWIADTAASVTTNLVTDASSTEGLFEDYETANRAVHHVTVDHGIPLTFWRSVGHSYTAFAKESAVDELASAAGHHPADFREKNAADPRLREVIRIAGERMKAMEVPEGHGLGIAAHTSFFSHVAEVAEVSVDAGQIRVHKVLCVVDCGRAVNPDVVRAQMEGGVMYGLTAALYGKVDFNEGNAIESNFHDYPILRMTEAPEVEVVIVDSTEDPTGVGEPGLPPIAPAVANAVFAATGQRLTSMPLKLA